MGYQLSARSRKNLEGVHPDLVAVVERAIAITAQDFMVIEGVRSVERQHQLYGQGRTTKELSAAGVNPALAQPGKPKATWTLKSNHFAHADGYGRAVDLVPYPVDWSSTAKFDAIADAMFSAAGDLGIEIRHGADWNQNGKRREKGEADSPHFELVN